MARSEGRLTDLSRGARIAYQGVRGHARYKPMFNSEDGRRERFQLLAAAHIYSADALRRFTKDGLHKSGDAADTPRDWLTGHPALASAEVRAGMDSASSSFRIVTAIELAEPSATCRSELLFAQLVGALQLKCLKHDTRDLSLEQSLAVIIAHRDSFGHGESGTGKGAWKEQRGDLFVKFCHCRILEAQFRQIARRLDDLRETL